MLIVERVFVLPVVYDRSHDFYGNVHVLGLFVCGGPECGGDLAVFEGEESGWVDIVGADDWEDEGGGEDFLDHGVDLFDSLDVVLRVKLARLCRDHVSCHDDDVDFTVPFDHLGLEGGEHGASTAERQITASFTIGPSRAVCIEVNLAVIVRVAASELSAGGRRPRHVLKVHPEVAQVQNLVVLECISRSTPDACLIDRVSEVIG